MGKSTGKWIKTVIFGKKSSKSSISENPVMLKEAINRSSNDLEENPSVVSDQAPHTSDRSGENSELEMGISANLPQNAITSLPGTQDADSEGILGLDSRDSDDITMQEKAATKAQAAFRGYLARRAFHALKGIITLQALIRGDLVRRQATANLLCTQGHLGSCQTELVLGQSQNEIEKVKRNFRKFSGSSKEAPEKSENVTLRKKTSPRKVSRSPVPDVPQKGVHSSEKRRDAVVSVLKGSKQPETQTTENIYTAEETLDVQKGDHFGVELDSLENGHTVKKATLVDGELNSTEDQTYKENLRTGRRRSFPVKQGYEENASQNSPTLPSYMVATESAKAKLRSEGSPKFGKDGVEIGLYRQHSLPSSANRRLNSMTSQMQKRVQENGRGGNKKDKSQPSSIDYQEKVAQAGWKR